MGVVVGWHLGDKPPSLPEKAAGQLDSAQCEHGLLVGILHPGGPHVGGTVVEHTVRLPGLELTLQGLHGRAQYNAWEHTPPHIYVRVCVRASQLAVSANVCPAVRMSCAS